MKTRVLAFLLILVAPLFVHAQGNGLQDGDRVAIIGDSITEQKQYSVFIEDYLLMCQPKKDIQTMQFGWGGETAPGFLGRMANDALPYKPTVATTCYGMNDGGYAALTDERRKHYTDATEKIVDGMKKAGVRFIVVGSPGAVDTTTFKNAEVYNKTLSQLAEAAHDVANKQGVAFVDVHAAMMDVMAKSKEKFGKDFVFAGKDGVHPGPNGHLVMAYAFLKALGCDGNIGEINVDLKSKKVSASDGHKVLSSDPAPIEIESSRYPFCFTSDELIQISQVFPFNADLNRLTLKVTGSDAKELKITWGGESKTFPTKDLAAGINLAAEFVKNPFVEPFKKAEEAIRNQQNFETPAVKETIHSIPQAKKAKPDDADALEKKRAETLAKQQTLSDAARAAVVPVKHTIKIEQ